MSPELVMHVQQCHILDVSCNSHAVLVNRLHQHFVTDLDQQQKAHVHNRQKAHQQDLLGDATLSQAYKHV